MGNLATNVKRRRKSYGYPTVDLARLLDVSAGLINNIENSKNDVFKPQWLNSMNAKLVAYAETISELKFTVEALNKNNPYKELSE